MIIQFHPEEYKGLRIAITEMGLSITSFVKLAVIEYSKQGLAKYAQRVAAKSSATQILKESLADK